MAKKTIAYIDGENFIHRVEDSLKKAGLIKKKEEILKFNVGDLLAQSLSGIKIDEIRYYGTKIRTADIKDQTVLEHAQKMVESQRRFKRYLINHGVKFVVAGSLRVRETTCYQCKKTSLVFKEKGVDVRLAVDLLEDASEDIVQVVVSSDSDLLPALKVAKQKSHIIYVHHAQQVNHALIKIADESKVFTHNQILSTYRKANS